MSGIDQVKEELETARDLARANWLRKARGVHQPSVIRLKGLREVDDARREYAFAQAMYEGALAVWIRANQIYEDATEASLKAARKGRRRT